MHPLVNLELEVNTTRSPGLSRGGRPSAQRIPRGDSVPQEALRPNLHLGEVRRGAGDEVEELLHEVQVREVAQGTRGHEGQQGVVVHALARLVLESRGPQAHQVRVVQYDGAALHPSGPRSDQLANHVARSAVGDDVSAPKTRQARVGAIGHGGGGVAEAAPPEHMPMAVVAVPARRLGTRFVMFCSSHCRNTLHIARSVMKVDSNR